MEKKNTVNRIMIAVVVILLTSMACSIGGLTIKDNVATLEIKLKEDQLITLFERIASQAGGYVDSDILNKLDSIDLHEGYVSLFGSYTKPDGTTVNGNFDLAISAQNGVLQAEIRSVDIPGVEIDEERIQQANETIAKELTAMVTETNGDVTFQRAEVHEDALYLTVQVKMRNTP